MVADESRRSPTRDVVVAILKAHGASGAAAAATWVAARRLVGDTRRRGVEHAATLDVASGAPLGTMLSGTAESIDLRPHLARMLPSGRYVVVHTHPMGQSFSALDVLVLATQPQIAILVAVGLDGGWHIASGPKGEDRRAAFDTYMAAFGRAASTGTNERERAHEAMQAVGARGLMRYDRVARDQDD